jgi:vitamin B12 transporter
MLPLIVLAGQAAIAATPAPPNNQPIFIRETAAPFTVTASRSTIRLAETGISISQIDLPQIEALSLPLVKDYLTLIPGVAVAQTGPLGAQTQIRIRGAEANHSISFIDGIEMNDPASSGEFRIDTLLSHGVERIEVLRGPQSALWGSQAIGGVISITTRAPVRGTEVYGELQGGSLGTVRGGIGGGWAGETLTVSGQLSGLSTDGYDIARSGGDKDGYDNVTAHGRIEWRATLQLTLLLVGRHQDSTSRFDGFDYNAGGPVDEPLATQSRQSAVRAEAALALLNGDWTTRASFMAVRADNINRRAGAFENRSDGERDLFRLQSTGRFETGAIAHNLTAALDVETERFTSRDANAQADSNQRQRRRQTSLVGEYRLSSSNGLSAGAAVRHDMNDRFADATTVRFDAVAAIPPSSISSASSPAPSRATPIWFPNAAAASRPASAGRRVATVSMSPFSMPISPTKSSAPSTAPPSSPAWPTPPAAAPAVGWKWQAGPNWPEGSRSTPATPILMPTSSRSPAAHWSAKCAGRATAAASRSVTAAGRSICLLPPPSQVHAVTRISPASCPSLCRPTRCSRWPARGTSAPVSI